MCLGVAKRLVGSMPRTQRKSWKIMENHKNIQSTPGTSLSVAVFPWRQIVKIYAAATKQTEWLERSLSTAGVVASSTENKLLWDNVKPQIKAKTPNSNDF
jgi:hypothetical protein